MFFSCDHAHVACDKRILLAELNRFYLQTNIFIHEAYVFSLHLHINFCSVVLAAYQWVLSRLWDRSRQHLSREGCRFNGADADTDLSKRAPDWNVSVIL